MLNLTVLQFSGVTSLDIKLVFNVRTDAVLLGTSESIICLTVTLIYVEHFGDDSVILTRRITIHVILLNLWRFFFCHNSTVPRRHGNSIQFPFFPFLETRPRAVLLIGRALL